MPWGLPSVDKTQSRGWLHGTPGRKGQDSLQGPLPLLLAWRAPSVSSTLAPQKKTGEA